MQKTMSVICFLALMAFAAQQAGAATTYHVFAAADNVSPNFTTIAAAVSASSSGDTISFDDSTTFTVSAGQNVTKVLSFVAASGCAPVIRISKPGIFAFNITVAGVQIGSANGGTITIDGASTATRAIYFDSNQTAWSNTVPSTSTVENVVFKNFAVGAEASNTSAYCVIAGNASATKVMHSGTLFNFRYVDFQFPAGAPTAVIATTNNYTAVRCSLSGGAVANFENVRANTLTGYIVTGGFEGANAANVTGTINLTNCKFVYDEAAKISHFRTGSPVALMNMNAGANAAGFTLNIDNSYVRSDSPASAYVLPTYFTRNQGTVETSNSLGAISLMNYSKNALNASNSAIVGCGAGINVDSTHSTIVLNNCDIYVPTASNFTAGNFINLSPRAAVASSPDHQCTATRCNFYGLHGSEIQAATRGAGSVFKMIQCNDWSPTDAYASNWVTDSCVQPGVNPYYGGNSNPASAIAAADFTVYNGTLQPLNIGCNRDFNYGVPVELSSFSVQ
ncbi:hypothetical protein LLG95_13945 [bacterium]|nr:hypothetical protein [bacterium]